MADVCLILEGTYPYVSGGVSAVVHQMISLLPSTTFTLLYIGATSNDLSQMKYQLPKNVVGLQEVFLFDELDPREKRNLKLSSHELDALALLHEELHGGDSHKPQKPLGSIRDLNRSLTVLFPSFSEKDNRLFKALASEGVWDLLVKEYQMLPKQVPFVDFFYTWRSAHLPIYKMLSIRYPKAQVYHALCTGFAGLAGLQAAQQNDAPFFITEHGIYAHERSIEISEAAWLESRHETMVGADNSSNVLRQWWVQLFRNMSKMAYGYASEIITLFEGNQERQLLLGAPPDRLTLIPNGINLKFRGLRRANPPWKGTQEGGAFQIGFIGRVVAIKDVKTLIKAVCTVYMEYKNIECKIIGPTEEEPGYYEECMELVKVLGMTDVIHFVGKMNVVEAYPTMDCLLLTSISEAQPLVVLEANAAGVPVVSTNVGSCQELLEGREGFDKPLGLSGLLAPIGNSEVIARQILRLINDPELWSKMSHSGEERVATFYEERELINRYDALYRQHIAGVARVSGKKRGVLPWQE